MGWKMGHPLAQNGAENGAALAPFRANGAHPSYIYSVCKKNSKLKKYSLSEVHFNTGRLLFQFNGLQYNL